MFGEAVENQRPLKGGLGEPVQFTQRQAEVVVPLGPDKEQPGSGGESIFTTSSSCSLDRFVSFPLTSAVEKRSRRRSCEDDR
jgi:hypothetical protein